MSNIGEYLKHSSMITCADDAVLITSSKCVRDIEGGLNKDINSIHAWLNENRLTFNLMNCKIKSMLFGTGKRCCGYLID